MCMQCKPVPIYPQHKARCMKFMLTPSTLLLSQAMFVGVFTKQLQKQICAHSSKDTLSTDTHKNSIKLFFLSKTFPWLQHTYYVFLTADKTVIRRHPKEPHYVRYLCSLRLAIFFSDGIFYFREPKKRVRWCKVTWIWWTADVHHVQNHQEVLHFLDIIKSYN
jgi:hypothetical protein